MRTYQEMRQKRSVVVVVELFIVENLKQINAFLMIFECEKNILKYFYFEINLFKIEIEKNDLLFDFSNCMHDVTQVLPFYAACIFRKVHV